MQRTEAGRPKSLYIKVGKENKRSVKFESVAKEEMASSVSNSRSLAYIPADQAYVVIEGDEQHRDRCGGDWSPGACAIY